MARRTRTVTIATAADNRDSGKKFLITEMSADKAEKWGLRVMLAIAQSGADVPDALLRQGMMGVAVVGIKGLLKMPFASAEPLLNEIFECVQIVEPQIVRAPTPEDIEEVTTRLLLRSEVIDLHINFSIKDFLSRTWQESQAEAIDENSTNQLIPPAGSL